MRHALVTLLVAALGYGGAGLTAQPAHAADVCVGGPGCFATIQAAVDAADDGDTIRVGPGTFAGGITILKSVDLVGEAAGTTTIEGGGPVITIGAFMGPQPTVSISRVTITGGMVDTVGVAAGGGVSIPFPGAGVTVATVTISDSRITHNRASPSGLFPAGGFCGPAPCAVAWGGGIDSSGNLTLTNTRVSDNVAGSTETDSSAATIAQGGGIRSHPGATLTILRSVVRANRAGVSPPNGRVADGGGIAGDGTLTVEDSTIHGNRSEVEAAVPSSFFAGDFTEANAGGLYLTPGSSATIRRSKISDNRVHSSNAAGDASAEAAGIDSDGRLLLTGSSVDNNTAEATVPASSGFLAETDAGGIQVQGETTVRDSRIVDNSLTSTSETGLALSSGGGLFNLSASLTLVGTVVSANSATATGVGGFNLGGGIGNVLFGGGPPELTLTDSVVTANRLEASDGILSQGGGLYTADPFSGDSFPVTLTGTVIEGNKPGQCVGC